MQRAYVKHLDMVLFKEVQQVEDYGRGAPHVRFFLDPNFAEGQVLDDPQVEARVQGLADAARPLRLLYFGRLVAYKGVDHMLRALAAARAAGANAVLDIMGDGPERAALSALVAELGLGDHVAFLPSRPYGEAFFEVLRARDVLLACPLSADTPRSTWDALASGMPVLAYDTPFYASMAAFTQAVVVTPWPEVAPFAARIAELARDKQVLAPMVRAGVMAARENTGASWLKRRVEWVEELMARRYGPVVQARAASLRPEA
jgi:glycosyltransferase involved in cell wall biosynthesis